MQQINSLSGKVEFVFNDKIDWVESKAYGKDKIADPRLANVGGSIGLNFDNEKGRKVEFVFPERPKYQFIRFVDANGRKVKTGGTGGLFKDNKYCPYWNFRAKFPEDAVIQVSCEQPRTVTIPFEVKNLKVESK